MKTENWLEIENGQHPNHTYSALTEVFRLSTLWHFIAYIDITDEQEMAKQKADERARMIENTKRQKNLEAEEAEQDDTLLEEDYDDFDDDYDDDDEFTNAFTKVPEPVISPPVKKKSNVFVPATGLKNSDRKFKRFQNYL